jgi:hypothetical protein
MTRTLQWIALTALFAGPAAAESPTFSFLDLAYSAAEDSTGGGSLRASAALGEKMLIQLDSNVREHMGGTVGHLSLGAGMHWPVADDIELAFTVSVDTAGGEFGSEDEGGISGVEVGGGAGLELRARLSSRLELNAGARFESVTDELVPSAGARFYFSERVAAGLRVVHDHFDTHVELGLHIDLGD